MPDKKPLLKAIRQIINPEVMRRTGMLMGTWCSGRVAWVAMSKSFT